jgi:hypothetical protein
VCGGRNLVSLAEQEDSRIEKVDVLVHDVDAMISNAPTYAVYSRERARLAFAGVQRKKWNIVRGSTLKHRGYFVSTSGTGTVRRPHQPL